MNRSTLSHPCRSLRLPLLVAGLWLAQSPVFADGINYRTHPEPGAQARINRVIAQSQSTGQVIGDRMAVQYGGARPAASGSGVSQNLSVGTVYARPGAPTPREVNVVTRDNIVICMHCR